MKQHHLARSGFTIVELLIVIVIVSLLATITIVSYSTVQNRSNNAAVDAAENLLSRKIQNYATAKGLYPTTSNRVIATDLATYPDSSMNGANITIGTPTAANGKTTFKVELCGAGAGVKITSWDYSTGKISTSPLLLGTTTGTCVQATG